MKTSPTTRPPSPETDNWDATAIEAPRQKAGDAIERQSRQADRDDAGPATSDEAEAPARRQAATGNGSSGRP